MPHPLLPGQKLFFPNVVFRLLRSNLPPQQAVFRCPPHLNKIDIKNILTDLYDLRITDVRTMNYLGRLHKNRRREQVRAAAYKKIIVTMEDDFVFPPPPETKAGPNTPGSQAAEMPKPSGFGRNSANTNRHKIEKGRPKGVGPNVQAWKEEQQQKKEQEKDA
ncbi:uncharacterized protein EV422DRAFT_8209 [Fimicolochytrium jonesii]|uniref:uncharacterized protein n=1 Tax=Fimicolochytrium jonesii TaxID=1396493 RepID=UPI0022FF1346|nr:uncharacterized protein EV422DRAFT_8209 [Fimicolochytrium jonesii]KAI8826735.1 hypothetical protein EV422DRAFT_8209 [Fimicolochytrium jonesii]